MQVVLQDEPLYVRQQPSNVVELNGTYYFADNIDESVHNVPLNGKISEYGKQYGIPTPACDILTLRSVSGDVRGAGSLRSGEPLRFRRSAARPHRP